jgi:YD repeat-containing protein
MTALVAPVLASMFAIGTQSIRVDASGATYGTPSEFTMGCCLGGGGSPFYPHETALADVNGDGIPDYLVANSFTAALDVHVGYGDGTFAPTVSYPVAGQPIGLAVGDLANNGIQDVVVADGGTAGYAEYTVLMGNGNGTFRLGGTYSIAYQVNDVELGDLNGDGKLDLVITSTAGQIAALFGNGDGTFGTPTYYATHGGAQTSTIADLNGDKHPDVVVAEGNPPGADSATIGVFLNNGNGTLAVRAGYTIGNTYATSVNVAVGDLNGDGAPDLAVSDGNCGFDPGHVEILLNNGGGTFVDKGSLSDGCTSDVALTNATGSGHLDVVSVSYGPSGSRVSVYPGNGDGTFGTEADYPPPDPNTQYRTFAVSDLNLDSRPDVITASGGNNNTGVNPIAAVYLNATVGPFVPVGGPVTTKEAHSPCHSCMAQLFTRPSHADPVDTVDGTFSEQYGDLMIPGRGLPPMFVRTYNSWAAGTTGPLGYGWTSSYGANLSQNSTTGVVTVTEENGSQVTFGRAGSGTSATYFPTAPRTIATLLHNGDGSWTFTRKTSETFKFSSVGLLTALTDRNGYSTTLTYNANNQLTQITDPESRSLTLGYTGSLLSSVTDPIGRVVTYGYNDGLGNLTDVTDVNGGNTHFTYDSGHHLLTIRDPRGNTVTTNHYDNSNRVDYQLDGLNQKTSFTYASDGSYTITTDPVGNQIKETFASGVRTSVTRGYGTSQAATWSFTYDPYTLGVTVVTDPNGHTTNRSYDRSGNQLTVADGLTRKTSYAYNSFNEPTTVTDPKGVTTTMSYDTQGNLLSTSTPLVGSNPAQSKVTSYTYGDSAHPGDVTAMTDPDNKVWHRSYDTYGDLTSSTDPLGNVTTYSYSTIGWLQSTVSPRGNVTGGNPSQFTTTYSYADPVSGATDEFGDVRVVTDPLGHTSTTSYDPDRNVVSSKDGLGNTTTYQYDADNEQTDVQRADGTTLHTDYDGDGTVKDQVDGAHNATSYGYDR